MNRQATSINVVAVVSFLKACIVKELEKHDDLTADEKTIKGVFNTLMDKTLYNYFKTKKLEAFVAHNNYFNLLKWMKNLMNCKSGGFGHLLLCETIDKYKQTAEDLMWKEKDRKYKIMLANHPLTPFEFTDPETGIRYYRTGIGSNQRIPEQVEPRPSDEVMLHPITRNHWVPRHCKNDASSDLMMFVNAMTKFGKDSTQNDAYAHVAI